MAIKFDGWRAAGDGVFASIDIHPEGGDGGTPRALDEAGSGVGNGLTAGGDGFGDGYGYGGGMNAGGKGCGPGFPTTGGGMCLTQRYSYVVITNNTFAGKLIAMRVRVL